MAPAQPELKKVRSAPRARGPVNKQPDEPLVQYLDKKLFVQLNGSRKVIGVLRGYDVFLNIVLDDAVEEKHGGEKVRLGMVVRSPRSPNKQRRYLERFIDNSLAGYPRKLRRYARSAREDWW